MNDSIELHDARGKYNVSLSRKARDAIQKTRAYKR